MHLCVIKVSLVYVVSSIDSQGYILRPCLKRQEHKHAKQNKSAYTKVFYQTFKATFKELHFTNMFTKRFQNITS